MNKQLKVFFKILDNFFTKYLETKDSIENDMKQVGEGESMAVEELI